MVKFVKVIHVENGSPRTWFVRSQAAPQVVAMGVIGPVNRDHVCQEVL